MEAAWNSFKLYSHVSKCDIPYPMEQKFVNDYIFWLFSVRNLKYSSVESYLSSLSSIFRIKGFESQCFSNSVTKILIRGGKSLETNLSTPTPTRKVMTIELLRVVGHEISISDWTADSKRVFWTACCTLFFGSFRVGELLSNSEINFDPSHCLLWEDVKIENDEILVHIKNPKVWSKEGEFVDLFPFLDKTCCPVRAIKGLKTHSTGGIEAKKPVFTFMNGRYLTPQTLNLTLRSLLEPHFGSSASEYSSHSFRAAVSSALARFPHLASEDDIKWRGRWNSAAFKKYTRLKLDERKSLHSRVSSALLYRHPHGSERGGPGLQSREGQRGLPGGKF